MSTLAKVDTEFVVVDGVNVATRTAGSGKRLVLLHRFRGTLDDWDPAFVSALATAGRDVFMFDSLGVGQTDGVTPATVEGMADFAASVIRAGGTEPVDVLGWSLGGFVAQVLAIKYPKAVRRVVLAGTMPAGGVPELIWSADWLKRASTPVPTAENALALLYGDSDTSRATGMASLGRMAHPPAAYVSPTSMATQATVISRFADVMRVAGTPGWGRSEHQRSSPTATATGCFPRSIPRCLPERFHAASWPSIPTAATRSCFSIRSNSPTTSPDF